MGLFRFAPPLIRSTAPAHHRPKHLLERPPTATVDQNLIRTFAVGQLKTGSNRELEEFVDTEFAQGLRSGRWFFLFDPSMRFRKCSVPRMRAILSSAMQTHWWSLPPPSGRTAALPCVRRRRPSASQRHVNESVVLPVLFTSNKPSWIALRVKPNCFRTARNSISE